MSGSLLDSLSGYERYTAILDLYGKKLVQKEYVFRVVTELDIKHTSAIDIAQAWMRLYDLDIIEGQYLWTEISSLEDHLDPDQLFSLYSQMHDMKVLSEQDFLDLIHGHELTKVSDL